MEEWLREHLHSPVSTLALANMADVSLRTLQIWFKQELDVPPHVYHARLRMRAARAFLHRHAPESASVALAATTYGFMHLGRFAVQYRSLFGESPSATLRRGARYGSVDSTPQSRRAP